MGRHKSAFNVNIRPWLSAHRDCSEGRFLQLGNSLLLSHKVGGKEQNRFLSLSHGAKFIYLCMCMESGGKREFKFPSASIKKYGLPVRSARRWIDELEENGFITCDHAAYTREANNYQFSTDWKEKPG